MGYEIELFLRMLIIGIAVAAPVGAMAVLSIQRTISHGWRAGMATGAGIASADAVFAALAAFGVSALAHFFINFQAPLRIIGGVGLLWLAWRALRSRPVVNETAVGGVAHGRLFASAVGLTLTNPMTIMAFAVIFAGAGLVAQPGIASASIATLGVAIGSLLWWLILVTVVSAVRHALTPRAMLVINRVSAIVLAVFGVLAIVAGISAI
ncbi:MAG: hypothetical protein RJB01_787 [Actinomycetota bacterium]